MGRDSVRYTTLRAPEVEVSRLCLGCGTVGSSAEWTVDDRGESHGSIGRIAALKFAQGRTIDPSEPDRSHRRRDIVWSATNADGYRR